jgi:hypothetical protein
LYCHPGCYFHRYRGIPASLEPAGAAINIYSKV